MRNKVASDCFGLTSDQKMMLLFSFFFFMTVLLRMGQCFASDSVMGNWEGEVRSAHGAEKLLRAKIIAEGGGRYRAVMRVGKRDKREIKRITGHRKKGQVFFAGALDLGSEFGGICQLRGKIIGRNLKGDCSSATSLYQFSMRRVQVNFPELGVKPAEKAVVLFDGSSLDSWVDLNNQPARWKLLKDKSMEVAKGNIITQQVFGDALIHLEFRTPLMPEARGQARGNSGVYVHGRYEIQVLDSFGLKPMDNGCGAIYKIASPRINASLPPMDWQTYDIVFRAPRFDSTGIKLKNAEISVRHNGQLIHDRQELLGPSLGGISEEEGKRGGLLLQDHRDPVQYRNIWILPLD